MFMAFIALRHYVFKLGRKGKRLKIPGMLIPSFNEASLFLMAFTFLLLLVLHGPFRNNVAGFFLKPDSWESVVLSLIFAAGLWFSLIHVFMKKRKSSFEKSVMLCFAVCVNAGMGLMSGVYLLRTAQGLSLFFSAWNFLNAFLLVYMYDSRTLNNGHITDEEAGFPGIFWGILIVIVIFYFTQHVFHTHWTVTFSNCVIYATSFNDKLLKLIDNN